MLRNRNEVERAVKNVNATLSFEGLTPSKNAERLNRKMLNGEISGEDARKQILSKYNL